MSDRPLMAIVPAQATPATARPQGEPGAAGDGPVMQLVTMDGSPQWCDVYTWRRLIRRIGVPLTVKGIAGILADYADPDGTRVRPGVQRLALVTGSSPRTVKRALAVLRDYRLITLVHAGAGPGRGNKSATGDAAEYRLTIPDLVWLSERVDILDPDEKPGNTGMPQTLPDHPMLPVDDEKTGATGGPPYRGKHRAGAENRGHLEQNRGHLEPKTGATGGPPPNQRPNHLPNHPSPSPGPYVAGLEGGDLDPRPVENPNQVAIGRGPPLAPARRRATG